MPWRIVERHIGRAGGLRERTARQREWDRKYGEGNWQVGYVEDHFAAHPQDLERHGLTLQGQEVVDIGSWQGKASHPISVCLSPLQIKVTDDPPQLPSGSGDVGDAQAWNVLGGESGLDPMTQSRGNGQ